MYSRMCAVIGGNLTASQSEFNLHVYFGGLQFLWKPPIYSSWHRHCWIHMVQEVYCGRWLNKVFLLKISYRNLIISVYLCNCVWYSLAKTPRYYFSPIMFNNFASSFNLRVQCAKEQREASSIQFCPFRYFLKMQILFEYLHTRKICAQIYENCRLESNVQHSSVSARLLCG